MCRLRMRRYGQDPSAGLPQRGAAHLHRILCVCPCLLMRRYGEDPSADLSQRAFAYPLEIL